jgi:hypothetical protein
MPTILSEPLLFWVLVDTFAQVQNSVKLHE